MPNTSHHDRVLDELKRAGVHPLELYRRMFKLLPDIIRSNEHIEAVAYGLNNAHWHAALVATDYRVIYIEADLMFSDIEEAPYEIIHGTERTQAPLRVGLTLKSKAGNYSLDFVNKNCADRFISYIEDRVEKMKDLPSGFAAPHDPIKRTNKKTHAYVDERGLPDIPLAHVYDVQREFLQRNHLLTITHKNRKNKLESLTMQYHLYKDALFAVAEQDVAATFDLVQPLMASVSDESGRTLQLEVLLKVEMSPVLLAKGLEADGAIEASSVYRLQIIDLAFVVAQK